MALIIHSGILVTDCETYQADILIDGERIVAIGNDFPEENVESIDACGKLIFPGGVDPHTHFDLPMFGTVSSDDHYTGHKAAAFGGTTTVIDFVSQDKNTLGESITSWHLKSDIKAVIDYGFHMNITHLDTQMLKELTTLSSYGISSIKVFMAYNNRLRLRDDEIFQVMRVAKDNYLLTMLHAENGDLIDLLVQEAMAKGQTSPEWHAYTRPKWSTVEAAFRGAALSAVSQAPLYLVHMNAAGEVDMLDYARSQRIPMMGETCPQYLFFTEEELTRPDGAKWICSPPLRNQEDNQRLWLGLKNQSIQVIGTDHCPFFFDGTRPIIYEGKPIAIPGKELGSRNFTQIPNGLPAVGDRMPILWTYGVKTGKISANQFVAYTSTNPAKIFGLYPKKGALLPGSDADLVIWDENRHITYGINYAQHRCDYNLYEGWKLSGFPEKVFLRGKLIVDQGKWLGKAGDGKFISRKSGIFL
jgi:dihydropyrimidinase